MPGVATARNESSDYVPMQMVDDESVVDENHKCESAFAAARQKHLACLAKFSNNELLVRDTFGQTPLHHAAKVGDEHVIKCLIDRVPELRDLQSKNGETAAHISAAHGDIRAIEVLLGGSLRPALKTALITDVNGTSVLMASVARGDNELSFWLLKRFGKALAILPNNCKMLPLHVAAAQGNIEFLRVATKYDTHMVNARDEYGCSPCVYAVQGGCLSSVRFLVEKVRGEVGCVSNRGQSLLHIASLCGHEHIVRWVLQRTGSDAILWTTKDRANAIHCAAFSGSVSVLALLLASWGKKKRQQVLALRDSRGNTPLHLAAINNHLDAALFLLENGSDPALVNASGHSAQGIAALRGHAQMQKLVAALNGKKKSKAKKKAQSLHDLSQFTSLRSGPMSPGGFTSLSNGTGGFGYDERERTLSPRDLSSGYSSNGDAAESLNSESAEIVRHRLRYLEDGSDSLRDSAAQTDVDPLQDHVKVIDDQTWAGLGLSAVEHIDRVLDEAD